MKEFIEKLIGRLEEYKYSHLIERDSEMLEHCKEKEMDCEGSDCFLCVWDKATEIVNQLAEEYKQCIKSSCSNCETYDKEKHYCPKWCDVIKGTVAEMDENRWIPCSERLPLFIDNVLVCTKSGGRTVACLTTGKRFCDTYMNIIDNVVAWMPLPPAYVSEEGRG